MRLTILNPKNPAQAFPPVSQALTEPDGLLAVGGCLSEQRLLNAYRQGIFPWYNEGEPILWWSPNPRMVLFPERMNVSRSLHKLIRKNVFQFTIDTAFKQVIAACAAPRDYASGTWISPQIDKAYRQLHQAGFAHSAEVWLDGELVGGLYGVALGQVFFGESMFHTASNASKVAFVCLLEKLKAWGYQLIDCQIHSQHLASLGAEEIARAEFVGLLGQYCQTPVNPAAWLSS